MYYQSKTRTNLVFFFFVKKCYFSDITKKSNLWYGESLMETMICNKCNKEKPLSEFYFRRDTGKYRKYCKSCKKTPKKETENEVLLKINKRRCKSCSEIKNLSEFYFRKEINKYRLDCKKCLLAKQSNSKPTKEKNMIAEPMEYVCKCCNIKKDINEFRVNSNKNKSNIIRHYRICYECEKQKNRDRHLKKSLNDSKIKLKYEFEQENKLLVKDNKKKCLICLQIKDLSEFYFRKDLNNYRQWCIECEKKRTKNFYNENKDEILEKQHQHYKDNREIMLERKKKYASTHKEQLKEYHTKYVNNRRKNDDIFHFKSQIRHLINMSFRRRGLQKRGKTEKIVGCDFETFNNYLLNTFKNNYGYEYDGKEEVHVDHIIPLSTATSEEELLKLNHYSNLQLLKAKDNLDKGDKIDWVLKNEK